MNGKPLIWEELVSCFLRLFSDRTTDYEDRISCNVEGDASIDAFSSLSSVFFEQRTRESWKLRCKWWMNRHFSQNIYMSETAKGNFACSSNSVIAEIQSRGAPLHLINFGNRAITNLYFEIVAFKLVVFLAAHVLKKAADIFITWTLVGSI